MATDVAERNAILNTIFYVNLEDSAPAAKSLEISLGSRWGALTIQTNSQGGKHHQGIDLVLQNNSHQDVKAHIMKD
jgi:hypothetical protein